MNTSQVKDIVSKSVNHAIAICGSQVALAKKANITQGAVGKYIRKEALPTGLTAKSLSRAVDGELSPADFAPHIFGD